MHGLWEQTNILGGTYGKFQAAKNTDEFVKTGMISLIVKALYVTEPDWCYNDMHNKDRILTITLVFIAPVYQVSTGTV